jgi:lysozyme family protein
MAVLEIALVYLLRNEGGIANQAGDHGGLTNMGVTQATYSTYLGRQATDAEVKSLTVAQATAVYRKLYWNIIKGDSIVSQQVATVVMDMAVLMGPGQATKLIQGILGSAADGILGPKTLAALNAMDESAFLAAFSEKCCTFFGAICARDTSQIKFLYGWQYRAHRMLAKPTAVA